MSQNRNQQLQMPYYTVTQMVQNNQINQLISFLMQLARRNNILLSPNYESIEIKQSSNQSAMIINYYLPHYIVQFTITGQNQVTITKTPSISVNCGGGK